MSDLLKAARELLRQLDLHQVAPEPAVDAAAIALAEEVRVMEVNQPEGWPIVCIDFDGVLHSYTSGWRGIDTVADPPVEGAIEWLVDLIEHEKIMPVIYSSRSKHEVGIQAMTSWLHHHLVEYFIAGGGTRHDGAPWATRAIANGLKFPTQKPPAHITIDDRGFHFEGRFPSIEEIFNFKPWYKR